MPLERFGKIFGWVEIMDACWSDFSTKEIRNRALSKARLSFFDKEYEEEIKIPKKIFLQTYYGFVVQY
jgi:hypothetical protein